MPRGRRCRAIGPDNPPSWAGQRVVSGLRGPKELFGIGSDGRATAGRGRMMEAPVPSQSEVQRPDET